MRRDGRDGRPSALEALCQAAHEEQIGELALAVGPPCAVLALTHEVFEVDATHAMSLRRHRDDASLGSNRLEQPPGEREVPQVIGAELHLEAVGGVAARDGHDPGVVDEHVETVGVGLPPQPGELIDRGQVGEIESLYLDGRLRGARADLLGGRLALGHVAHGEGDLGTVAGERQCGLEAQAGVGAGDDGPAAGLVGDIRCGPLVAHGPIEAVGGEGRQPGLDWGEGWGAVYASGAAGSRSRAPLAQSAERLHGKEKVYGSIP